MLHACCQEVVHDTLHENGQFTTKEPPIYTSSLIPKHIAWGLKDPGLPWRVPNSFAAI